MVFGVIFDANGAKLESRCFRFLAGILVYDDIINLAVVSTPILFILTRESKRFDKLRNCFACFYVACPRNLAKRARTCREFPPGNTLSAEKLVSAVAALERLAGLGTDAVAYATGDCLFHFCEVVTDFAHYRHYLDII